MLPLLAAPHYRSAVFNLVTQLQVVQLGHVPAVQVPRVVVVFQHTPAFTVGVPLAVGFPFAIPGNTGI